MKKRPDQLVCRECARDLPLVQEFYLYAELRDNPEADPAYFMITCRECGTRARGETLRLAAAEFRGDKEK